MGERTRGIIVRDFTDRGFGFIRDDNSKEHFFHYSDCKNFIPELGMEILCDIGYDKQNRTKCINIERARQENEKTD